MKLPARQDEIRLGVSRDSLRERWRALVGEALTVKVVSRRDICPLAARRSERGIVQPLKTLLADDPDYSFDILEARHAIEASTAGARRHAGHQRADKEDQTLL